MRLARALDEDGSDFALCLPGAPLAPAPVTAAVPHHHDRVGAPGGGPLRLHLEATLNLAFNFNREREGGGLGRGLEAVSLVIPIGLGVHYVFGER